MEYPHYKSDQMPISPGMTRGELLRKSALTAFTATAAGRLLMAESATGARIDNWESGAYLPLWSNGQKTASRIDLHELDRIYAAFAIPNTQGEVDLNYDLDPMVEALGGKALSTEVFLAIGGWGEYNNAWLAAARKPELFAASTKEIMNMIKKETGIKVTGVDLDIENLKSGNLPVNMVGTLATALRNEIPGTKVTAAVHADVNYFDGNPKKLNSVIDRFNVMTYDLNGPGWSPKAADLAPGKWVKASIDKWVKTVGNAGKIAVGFPAYGYVYHGAKKRGDTHKVTKDDPAVLYRLLKNVVDNDKTLTSEAKFNGSWVSTLSPRIEGKIVATLLKKYPDLGGAFVWDTDGMVPAHLQAIEP